MYFCDSSAARFTASDFKGQTRCSKDYHSPGGLCIGQISDFPRVSGLLRIQVRLHRSPCFIFHLPRSRASLAANHKRSI